MLPNPKDEMVLETADNGRADPIETFNDRHLKPVAKRFRCLVPAPVRNSAQASRGCTGPKEAMTGVREEQN